MDKRPRFPNRRLGVTSESRRTEPLRVRRDRCFCTLLVLRDGGDGLQRAEVSSAQSWVAQEAFGKSNLWPQNAQTKEAAAPLTGSFGAKTE